MKEIEFERKTVHLCTVKKKSDLLSRTSLTPSQVNGAIKRMGEILPVELKYAESFACDLFDFLLDDEHHVFDECSEIDVREDLIDYVTGSVWTIKHKSRTIKTPEITVFMDVRKNQKDLTTNIAMIINRSMKNHDLQDRNDLRIAFQEEVEALGGNVFDEYFVKAGLLPAP